MDNQKPNITIDGDLDATPQRKFDQTVGSMMQDSARSLVNGESASARTIWPDSRQEGGRQKVLTVRLGGDISDNAAGDLDFDEDDDNEDAINLSDFLNSRGELTGLAEWTDSDHDLDDIQFVDHKHNRGNCCGTKSPRRMNSDRDQNFHASSSKSLARLGHPKSNPVFSGFGMSIHHSTEPGGWSYYSAEQCGNGPNFNFKERQVNPFESESRNLTNAQILEEVKQMYAEDRLFRKLESEDVPDNDNDLLGFLINDPVFDDNPKSNSATTKGPIAAGEAASHKQNHVTEEPEFTKSRSWVCSDEACDQGNMSVGLVESSQSIPSTSTLKALPEKAKKENVDALNRLWTEIQETKQRLESDMNSLLGPPLPNSDSSKNVTSGKRPFPVPLNNVDSALITIDPIVDLQRSKARHKRPLRKARGKHYQSRTSESKNPSKITDPAILNEIDQLWDSAQNLHDSDLEDLDKLLLNEIGEDGLPNEFPLDTIESSFQHLTISNEECKISLNHYKKKYFEEKYRRDHCEVEIGRLQKELLQTSEKVAVLDGILEGKDLTISKLRRSMESLLDQYKFNIKGNRDLHSEYEKVKSELNDCRIQLADNEKDLRAVLQQNQELESRIREILEESKAEELRAQEKQDEFDHTIKELESMTSDLRVEKDSILQDLHDIQSTLTETKEALTVKSSAIHKLESEVANRKIQFQKEREASDTLHSQIVQNNETNSSLQSEVEDYRTVVERLKAEQVILESTLESECRQKLKEERERLHSYYNGKIQEILQSESKKMIEAEKEFVELHEQKLHYTEQEAERRLEEMRSKFMTQVNHIKQKFEDELALLKQENEDKGKLIDTVTKQFKTFSERCSGGSKYLENPDNHRNPTTCKLPVLPDSLPQSSNFNGIEQENSGLAQRVEDLSKRKIKAQSNCKIPR